MILFFLNEIVKIYRYYNRRFSIINKNEGKELSRVKSIIQDVKGGIGNG